MLATALHAHALFAVRSTAGLYMVDWLCRSSLDAISKQPQDLEQLADAVALHKRLLEDKAKTAARFDPLRCCLLCGRQA
jgi:hypothetical protein